MTPATDRPILVIGSCMTEKWQEVGAALLFVPPVKIHLLNAGLPERPLCEPTDYAFQLVQLPLRLLLLDQAFARLVEGDAAGHRALFNRTVAAMMEILAHALRWNVEYGLLTFVISFTVPQQNPMGRLMPRHELSNAVHFVEHINVELARQTAAYANAYLFDADAVFATLGRLGVQEDAIAAFNHGRFINDHDWG